jgi:hypothetical protein
VRFGGEWQRQKESASTESVRLNLDLATHRPHEAPRRVEADP